MCESERRRDRRAQKVQYTGTAEEGKGATKRRRWERRCCEEGTGRKKGKNENDMLICQKSVTHDSSRWERANCKVRYKKKTSRQVLDEGKLQQENNEVKLSKDTLRTFWKKRKGTRSRLNAQSREMERRILVWRALLQNKSSDKE